MTSKKFTISMIALALLGSAGFGGAGAFAATNSTSTTSTASNQATTKPTASSQTATKSSNARHGHHGMHGHHRFMGGVDAKALAADLHITAKTLRADLRAGQSLNQIATAQGVSSSTLLSDAQALVAARLAKAEASGHLTATQVTTIGQKIDAKLPNVLNHVFKAKNPTVNATTTTSTAVGSTTNA